MTTRATPITNEPGRSAEPGRTNEPGCARADTVPHLSDTVPHLSCRLEAMIAEGLRLKALAQMRRATKASTAP